MQHKKRRGGRDRADLALIGSGTRTLALTLSLGAAACSAPAEKKAPVKAQEGALSGVNSGHAVLRAATHAGCFANTLPKCDDCSTDVDLQANGTFPGGLNFHGSTYTSLYINNNGNLTFGASNDVFGTSDLSNAGVNTGLPAGTLPIIAPFLGDVKTDCLINPDTGACLLDDSGNALPLDGGTVRYGATNYDLDGVLRPAFCVTWDGADMAGGVGYFEGYSRRNQFQVLLVNRDDRLAGDFDIVFNYDKIGWESGQASCLAEVYQSTRCEFSNSLCVDDSQCDQGASERCLPTIDPADCAVDGQSIAINHTTKEILTDSQGLPKVFAYTPRIGYYSGNPQNPAALFELPGSGVSQAFVDRRYNASLDNISSGLIWNNSISGAPDPNGQAGRYVFEIQNDPPAGDGSIAGQIQDANGAALANAPFEVCQDRTGGLCLFRGRTDSGGQYQATGLGAGSYIVRAFPPTGASGLPAVSAAVAVEPSAAVTGVDLALATPQGPPADTSVTPARLGLGGVPVVYWSDPLTLSKTGCPDGRASYAVRQGPNVHRNGELAEGPAGTYTQALQALYPLHGNASVSITLTCPDNSKQTSEFSLYVNPSGIVRTLGGHPIADATVTLLRWEGRCSFAPDNACSADVDCAGGDTCQFDFLPVPDGSDLLSPAIRQNPQTSDAQGRFGWDVAAGYYKIRAEKVGCVSGDLINPGPTVDSNAVRVPPASLDAEIRLDCGPEPQDGTPPVITTPVRVSKLPTEPEGAIVTFVVTATDNVDGYPPVTCVPASGSRFPMGTTTVTCTASDISGNAASRSFPVDVKDTVPPTLTVPGDLTVEATQAGGALVDYSVTATDNAPGDVTTSCTPASGGLFALGTTTVNCTATDVAANVTERSFKVLVQDTTAPAINAPDSVRAETHKLASARVKYSVSAADLVDGAVAVSCTPASNSFFAIGTTTVSCTAVDRAGNRTSDSFDVTLVYVDTTAPVLTVPGTQNVEATQAGGAAVSYTVSAIDEYDGPVAATCAPASGSLFPVGQTTVSCSARDSSNNVSTRSFRVNVRDNTPPELQLPANLTVNATFRPRDWPGHQSCGEWDDNDDDDDDWDWRPRRRFLGCWGHRTGAYVSFVATATDVVDGSVPVTCNPDPGSFFRLGKTTVNCRARDRSGNVSTGRFVVLVQDKTPPTLDITLPTNLIWPANRRMVKLSIIKRVSDDADPCPRVSCSVVSSEPAVGGGSGNTASDISPMGPTYDDIFVRAERSSSGKGRTYTVTCVARDQAGNTTTRTGTVRVPLSAP